MKKVLHITGALVLTAVLSLGLTSFTRPSSATTTTEKKQPLNVEWKIYNDTGKEFNYCVNGGHNYISSGSTKSFSYSEGQEFFYIDGSNCGKFWMEAKSSMNGKEYKLSDLI